MASAVYFDEVAMVPAGIRILIGRSNTDEEGTGVEIATLGGSRIPPQAAAARLIDACGVSRRVGVPQGDASRAVTVKPMSAAAGPSWSRRGEAARRSAKILKMRGQSQHNSLEVLSDYLRNHQLFAPPCRRAIHLS